MRNDYGIVGLILGLGIIIIIVYFAVMLLSALVMVGGAGGVLWGGGTAIVNYFKSFKENMVDSNVATA